MSNAYLANAYGDAAIDAAVKRAVPCPRCKAVVGVECVRGGLRLSAPHAARLRKGYAGFQEMVARMSLEGLSLASIADRLGLVAQRFTAYHAKWMLEHAKPLDLKDV